MGPEDVKHWYDFLLPVAEKGGPLLTLALAIILVLSTWYGLWALRECVVHNRALAAQMLSDQRVFRQDLLLALAHCPPVQAPR